MGTGWEIRLGGPLEVRRDGAPLDGIPGRQGRLLLAYLALNRERACTRGELIDLLWPEDPPPAADTALSALLSKLRRVLGADALAGRSEVRLALKGPVRVDAEEAAAAARRAEGARLDSDWPAARAAAREALALDPAALLAGCAGPWADAQRRAAESARVRALELLAEACLHIGALGEAEAAARAAVAAAPFRESAHRQLMEAHEAAGNPAEALRVFEELRRLLREELGTAPGPPAMAVHARVLHGRAPARPLVPPPAVASEPPRPRRWPAAFAAARARHAFVGRELELGALAACWREAAAGAHRLALICGDAGIGKTRLAAELAWYAHQDGAVVLHGRFDEQGGAPYQPVVELLRGYARGGSLAPLAERLGPRGAELALVLPELGPAPGAPGRAVLRGPEDGAHRLRLFDALAALLAELAAGTPLLVVLDDLHWADDPSLQLLSHLVRAPAPEGALFLATARGDEGADRIGALFAPLRREQLARRIDLAGLDAGETGDLVSALGALPETAAFVGALHEETGGNPFFIEEVVRHLADADGRLGGAVALSDAGVPDGVREVTARRLGRLGEPVRGMLATAAVLGRVVDFDLLDATGPLHGDALVDALEAAVDARVLREDAERVGRYAFTHALMRATLYDSVSALRRARLHRQVGEALLERRGAQLDAHLGQLAHHFALAAPVEGPQRAVEFALAAGRRADRQLAWEEAAGFYHSALRTREAAGAGDDRLRCELLLALGASEERAGMDGYRATFQAAAAVARALGDAELLGRAALGYAGRWSQLGRVEEDVAELLAAGLEAQGSADSPLRARLLARLALEQYYAGDPGRRLALSDEAVALARRLGDPVTLAICLDARHYALWRPETVQERLAVAAELRRTAQAVGDPELELEGMGWTVVNLLERGDMVAADRQIAAATALAERTARPLYLWWTSLFACTRAQIVGEFEAAEQLALSTLAVGRRGQAENAMHYFAIALFNIRREQGRLGEVEEAVRGYIELYPAVPAWRCALAALHMELGREDLAREELGRLVAAGGVDGLPRDANWLIAVTLLAEVAVRLRAVELAGPLYDALSPYAGRNVVVGRAATCNGAAARFLGLLATVLGEFDVAERHLASALAMHESMGARPLVIRTRLAQAELALARGDGGAAPMLAAVARAAAPLGMEAVRARAEALGAEVAAAAR